MATLADIRGRVRVRLEEASAAVWTDGELDEAITSALELYSERFPLEATASTAVAAGATSAAMPPGARSVVRVTTADGLVIPTRGGPSGRTSDEELAWETFAGTIWFSRPLDGQSLSVWYLTNHDADDVPAADVGLLVLGGVWKALEQRSVQDLKRSGPVAGAEAGFVVRRAREEFERAFSQRARRTRTVLLTRR